MIYQPHITPVPMQNRYVVNKDYSVKYKGQWIVVPKYFTSDGASIPAIVWLELYTPFHPIVIGPALVHDWLYASNQTSKPQADKILYGLLILNHANKIKAKLIYDGVRIGGAAAWEPSAEKTKRLQTLYELCKDSPDFDKYGFPSMVDSMSSE